MNSPAILSINFKGIKALNAFPILSRFAKAFTSHPLSPSIDANSAARPAVIPPIIPAICAAIAPSAANPPAKGLKPFPPLLLDVRPAGFGLALSLDASNLSPVLAFRYLKNSSNPPRIPINSSRFNSIPSLPLDILSLISANVAFSIVLVFAFVLLLLSDPLTY